MKRLINDTKGFSLIELLVIVLILGVLAAIALPSYRSSVERSKAVNSLSVLNKISNAQVAYKALKGSYSSTLSPLALELIDSNGQVASGDTFEDDYFTYTVYGEEQKNAVAKRKHMNYELTISYDTGEIVCIPEASKICKSFDLVTMNNASSSGGSSSGGSSSSQDDNTGSTQGQEGGQTDTVELICNDGVCEYYVNGEKTDSCDASNMAGCYEQFGLSGLLCNEDGVCEYYLDGGKKDGECNTSNMQECYDNFDLSINSFICVQNGQCTTLQNNQASNSNPYNITEGTICNNSGCYSYQDGQITGYCSTNNGDCQELQEQASKNGIVCSEENNCTIYNEGEEYMQCIYSEGLCHNLKTGEDCEMNATATGCVGE